MSVEICECNGEGQNTGRPLCPMINAVSFRRIAMKTTANDGVKNSINSAVTMDEAYFLSKINHADPSKRWYPLPAELNIEDVRAESIKETFNNDAKYFVKTSPRSSQGVMVDVGPEYISVLEELRCGDYSIFEIDINGSIIGMIQSDSTTLLYPMPIAKGTIDVIYGKAKDKEIAKIMFMFEYAQSFLDKNIRQIKFGSDAGYTGIDLKTVDGLLSVIFAATPAAPDVSASTIVVKLATKYAEFGQTTPVTGLVIGDFVSAVTPFTASRVYNVTAAAALTISSVVETPATPGEYTITTSTAFLVGDVLRIAILKTGLDGAELKDGAHDLPPAVA